MLKGEQEQLFAFCFEMYQKQMKAYNAVDLLIWSQCLFYCWKPIKEVRERWQSRIRYLLVDEYQDTNTSQYELVRLLVGERGRLTVVGDDDQSIYSWRGAKPQNLVLLGEDYPNLRLIKLEQNYRSTSRICVRRTSWSLITRVYEKSLFSGDPGWRKT